MESISLTSLAAEKLAEAAQSHSGRAAHTIHGGHTHELRQTVLFITHSISESVTLSDRVALMSRGPGRIKDVVTIGFPRPRQPDLASTPEYAIQFARVWGSIRGESLRQE